MTPHHNIDVMSSGGGSDGPRRHIPYCLTCDRALGTVSHDYDATLTIAGNHRATDGGALRAAPTYTACVTFEVTADSAEEAYQKVDLMLDMLVTPALLPGQHWTMEPDCVSEATDEEGS